MYIVSLGFDDGLLRSTLRTAELFEQFGLSAGFNVIATGGEPTFEPPDPWHLDPKGDFALWNELQVRGHEIMPHGYRHAHLGELPLAEAQSLIRRSLEIFEARLQGFDRQQCVYALPYNESTAALEAWLAGRVGAFRTGGDAVNPLPASGRIRLTSAASGPAPCDDHLETQIARLFRQPEGWLVYTAHGLDGEGWGPLSSITWRNCWSGCWPAEKSRSCLPGVSCRSRPRGKVADMNLTRSRAVICGRGG